VRRARGGVAVRCVVVYAPHRGCHGLTTRGPAHRFKGASEGRAGEGCPKSAAKDSIEAGVLHLEHSEGALSFARIATTLLHERLLWVTMLLYPTASEREECMLSMLFWVLAALAVVGALAIVWGLYLLVCRWL
jgi:hypothetical protein